MGAREAWKPRRDQIHRASLALVKPVCVGRLPYNLQASSNSQIDYTMRLTFS
jgi:hypothetical protein